MPIKFPTLIFCKLNWVVPLFFLHQFWEQFESISLYPQVQAIVDSHHGTDIKANSKVRFSEPGAGGEETGEEGEAPASKGTSPQLSHKGEKEREEADSKSSPKKAVTV